MADIARIKGNIAKMIAQNAPETDIDAYVASEGISLGDLQAKPESPSIASAVTDIPSEIKRTFGEAVQGVKQAIPQSLGGLRDRSSEGTIEGLLNTGKGALSAASIPFTPIQGALRSLIGHPLAEAERAIGGVINPEAAARRTPEAAYEDWRGNVDTALIAAGPRSATAKGPVLKPPPSALEIKSAAKAAYQSPEVKGLQIDPASPARLSAQIESDLISKGFRPTQGNAPGAFSAIGELKPGKGVTAVSVDDIDSARRALGVTAKQRDPFGQPTPDAAAASMAIRKIDDYLENIAPTDVLAGNASAAQAKLAEARANYASGKRASEIDFRLNKAERQAAKSGSGMNLENARRQKIDQVSDYGLKPDEIALRDKIVLGTGPRNTLRTVGKLGVDGGLSLMLNAGAAMGTGGATLPVTAAATLARLIGQGLTKKQIRQLNEMIRARSPLARSQATPLANPNGLLSALYPSALPSGMGLLSPMPQILNER